MNNKGQTLVLFIILIPIIITLFVFVIDIGFLYIEKRNIENVMDRGIEYYKENKDVENYINKNIDDVDSIDIENNNGVVEITIKKVKKGIFKNYDIEITKKG